MISFVTACVSVSSQLVIPVASQAEIRHFLTTTTYIVLHDRLMSDYNDAMQQAVGQFWTITPYRFIREAEFDKFRYDTDKSFLTLSQVYLNDDKTRTLFDFLVVTNGGHYRSFDDMPALCHIPMCYFKPNNDDPDYIYKLAAMVKYAQYHILTCKANPKLNSKNIIDFYLSDVDDLSGKTLLLLKSETDASIRNTQAFAEIYPHKFQFSATEDIENELLKPTSDKLILHLIKPLPGKGVLNYCMKFVMEAATGKIYYFDMQKVGNKDVASFLKSDLKKLANR